MFEPVETFKEKEIREKTDLMTAENDEKIKDAERFLLTTDYTVIKAYEYGQDLETLYPGVKAKREESRKLIRSFS